MADRTVKTIVTADVKGFVGGMTAAAAAAKSFATGASRSITSLGAGLANVASQNSAAWGMVSTTMLTAGAAIAGGLGLAGKAAIDWESAWAGVTKTVDGSADQMAVLESQLRGLAKTLPATHGEIAAVAEAAGQLGIERQSIARFTKTMIDLGETTNLSADQAATSMAQMMNIMGTSASQVDRLGSTLVALGNAGASTEAQILDMGQRIAAAGSQMGMTEASVLALANAVASTGVNAEMGGTAISKSLIDISSAVRESGAGLAELASLTNMTTAQFKRAWQTDAAGAMASVVEGLGRLKASGGDVDAALGKLGISGQYQTDTMKRLALSTKAAGAQQDLLRDSLALGKLAWDENNALVKEASERYETTASKAQVALNNISDAGITLGSMMLPVIGGVLDSVTSLAQGFGNLPPVVQQGTVAVAALAAGALLLGGGFMKAIAWAKDLKVAIGTLKTAMAAAKISMVGVSVAAAGLGALVAVAGAAFAAFASQQQKMISATNDYTQALQESSGAIDENVRSLAAKKLTDDGAIEAAQKLGISVNDVTAAALGNAAAMGRVQAAMDKYRNDTHSYATGSGQQAKSLTEQGEAAKTLAESLKTNSSAFTDAAVKAKQYRDANSGSASASSAASSATADLASKTSLQRSEISALLEVTQRYATELLGLSGSETSANQARLNAIKVFKDNANATSKDAKGYWDKRAALEQLGSQSKKYVADMIAEGKTSAEVAASTKFLKETFLSLAKQAGYTAQEVSSLTSSIFNVPDEKDVNVTDEGSANALRTRIENLTRAMKAFPTSVQSRIQALVDRGKIDDAERALNRAARERNAVIYARVSVDGTGAGKYSLAAAGGVTEFFAAGGSRDAANRHIAELAPAGTTRVWREPETQGEGYVPLANDWRRPRAKAVVSELARRFGGEVTYHEIGGVNLPAYVNGSLTPASFMGVPAVPATVVQVATPDALREAFEGVRVDLANGRLLFDAYSAERERGLMVKTSGLMGV